MVFGHTPMRGVLIDLPYKIGIDTGLVYGGMLTCVEFTEGVCYQVQRGQRVVKTVASSCAERVAALFRASRAPLL